MLLKLLTAAHAKSRVAYAYAEHVCAIGYAASESFPIARHFVMIASVFLIACLAFVAITALVHLFRNRICHPRYAKKG